MNSIVKKIRHGIYVHLYGDCLSERRAKWTAQAVRHIPKGSRILDAGAGECKNRKYCRHLKYVSQDFCAYVPDAEDSILQPSDTDQWDYSKIDIVSDITDIPVGDASFDAVICTEVLEHLVQPESAIREFARILKGGGQLITTAPEISGNHMMPYIYWTGISEFWYRSVYEKYGFQILKLEKCGNYFDYLTDKCILSREYTKFYGKKMNLFDSFIMFCASLVMKKYAKKTTGSEQYGADNVMIVAVKK